MLFVALECLFQCLYRVPSETILDEAMEVTFGCSRSYIFVLVKYSKELLFILLSTGLLQYKCVLWKLSIGRDKICQLLHSHCEWDRLLYNIDHYLLNVHHTGGNVSGDTPCPIHGVRCEISKFLCIIWVYIYIFMQGVLTWWGKTGTEPPVILG